MRHVNPNALDNIFTEFALIHELTDQPKFYSWRRIFAKIVLRWPHLRRMVYGPVGWNGRGFGIHQPPQPPEFDDSHLTGI